MKYPGISAFLGQLILNQTISFDVFNDFYDELQIYVKEEDFYNVLNTTYWTLKEASGCSNLNNIENRKFILGSISGSIESLIDRLEVLDTDPEYKENEVMPSKAITIVIKTKENKDGSTVYTKEY